MIRPMLWRSSGMNRTPARVISRGAAPVTSLIAHADGAGGGLQGSGEGQRQLALAVPIHPGDAQDLAAADFQRKAIEERAIVLALDR